jgi:predicted glutamine amidotransferase
MCGIVAVFGKVGLVEERVFCDLLQVDVLRGSDSTGIAAIRLDGSAKVMKDTVLPTELLMRSHVHKMFNKVNMAYIGHNRAATKGKVTAKNAHPFVSGHITGVHNGTLLSEVGLVNAHAFDTDSEAIFDHIRQKGIADAWENLDGAASLVWWDAKEKSFNFIRNIRRPLHFAYTADRATMFVASEAWMLEGCVERRGGITIEEVKYPKADNHFRFKWTFKDGIKQTGGLLAPFARIITPVTASFPISRGVWKGNSEWDEKTGKFVPNSGQKGEKDSTDPMIAPSNGNGKKKCTDGTPTKTPRGSNDEAIEEEIEELFAKPMTEKKFHKQFKACTFCRSALDYESSVVLDLHNAACGDCVALADDENIQLVGGM